MGLREEKKRRTRLHLAETAWTLFADRGFDRVTVAQVADAAQVSEATVFNYFDSKEDLFFDRLDEYGHDLVAAVAERPPGEGVLAAFRRLLLAPRGLLGQISGGDPRALERLRTVNQVIADSPALQAREQLSLTRIADALAEHLVAATPGTARERLAAQVVAHTLIAVQRSLVLLVREMVLAAELPPGFGEQVGRLGTDAFDLLERGLGDYGATRP